MSASELTADSPSLTVLRAVAVLGAIGALVAIVFAFTVSLVLGLVALAVAPVIPLTLVVVVDRFFRR